MSESLHVVQIVTTLARGGAQATVLRSSRTEPGDDVRITVLAGPDDPSTGTFWNSLRPDLDVRRIGAMRRAIRPVSDVRALIALVRWLRLHRPDLVHTHSSKAGVLGRLAARFVGVPVVHTVHGWSFEAIDHVGVGRPLLRYAAVLLERALARITEVLVVVTDFTAESGLEHRVGRPEQYVRIRSGLDLSEGLLDEAERRRRREALSLGDRYVVGTVGRHAAQKDLATLLRGFAQAQLDDAVLVLIGDGPLRGELEVLARRLGIESSVRFLGMRASAARDVAAFDLFVLSSRWEGLPRALIEATAAGVPAIGTDVGGIREILSGDFGELFPVGDAGALAEAMQQARRCPIDPDERARRSAAVVKSFSADEMVADLRRLWRAVASGAGVASLQGR